MRQCEQACLRSGWPYGGTRGWAACREAETRPGRDSAFRHYSGLRSGRGDTTGEFLGVAFSDAAPPNGEDLLYVFRARVEGHALLDDGTLLVLRAGFDQAARVQPIQRWHPPYVADSYVAARPVGASTPALIGNAELVRGISNCRPVARLVADKTAPTTGVYETLLAAFARATDQHHWRDRAEVGDPLRPLVRRQGSGSWLSGGGRPDRGGREPGQTVVVQQGFNRVEVAKTTGDIRCAGCGHIASVLAHPLSTKTSTSHLAS